MYVERTDILKVFCTRDHANFFFDFVRSALVYIRTIMCGVKYSRTTRISGSDRAAENNRPTAARNCFITSRLRQKSFRLTVSRRFVVSIPRTDHRHRDSCRVRRTSIPDVELPEKSLRLYITVRGLRVEVCTTIVVIRNVRVYTVD